MKRTTASLLLLTAVTFFAHAQYDRRVVCEELTGTWCGWCVSGFVYLGELERQYGERFIPICVHQNDVMQMADYAAYITELGSAQGLPYALLNRNRSYGGAPADLQVRCDYLMRRKSEALVSLTAQLDEASQTVEATVTTTFAQAQTQARYRLTLILVEDSVHQPGDSRYDQANYYSGNSMTPMGGYEDMPRTIPAADMYYNNVARYVSGDFDGVPLSVPATFGAEEPLVYNETFALPPTVINPARCKLVAILLDDKGNEVNADCCQLVCAPVEHQGISDMGIRSEAVGEWLLPHIVIRRYADGTTKKFMRTP
ncbi:MAG: Omp28-related outer membrane protein [Prevotella sp.]|nr:Omp28-related outer membrane protein [Prevotella sp.]